MMDITVDDRAVRAKFDKMPKEVHDRLKLTVGVLAEKLRSYIVSNKLLGQVLQRRSGRLGRSIKARTEDTAEGVTGFVFSSGDVPYARIQEYGGKTAAHVIEAKNGKALAFMMGGRQVFFRKVNHPGSNIPERSYMRSSLADMRDEIIAAMKKAVGEGTKL